VLVCEVMGQQTQATRIEQFLPRFLAKFPTVEALAQAKKSEVIREWQGLGYNRRALNLQQSAIALCAKPFPKNEKELLTLPGIGSYTASAILIFAFNKPLATVDVNIERVLSRLNKKMPDQDTVLPKKQVYQIAKEILPAKNSRLWHEALMDFGATICTKRNPNCDECPLSHNCKSRNVAKAKIKKSTMEKIFFAQPKRIWRGRVLKLLIQPRKNYTTPETYIIDALQNSFPKTEFRKFIRSILNELTREGFCEKKNNIYRLHQG
jgi:A/G-specific adenine glycosylase